MFIPVWLAGLTIAVLFLLAIGLCVLWQYKNHLWDCINRREQYVDILDGKLHDQRLAVYDAIEQRDAALRESRQMRDELSALADSWLNDPTNQ